MKRKGYDFQRANHLTHRPFNPELDLKRHVGKIPDPKSEDYSVVVSRKAVRKMMVRLNGFEDPGQDSIKFYVARQQTPCLPFTGHSRTNMIYGTWRKQNRGRWFWVQTGPSLNPAQFKAAEAAGDDNPEGWEQQWISPHWTRPVYWIEDSKVYTATDYRYTDPKEEE